jgi:hypothetical protein
MLDVGDIRLGLVFEVDNVDWSHETSCTDLDAAIHLIAVRETFADAVKAVKSVTTTASRGGHAEAASVSVRGLPHGRMDAPTAG